MNNLTELHLSTESSLKDYETTLHRLQVVADHLELVDPVAKDENNGQTKSGILESIASTTYQFRYLNERLKDLVNRLESKILPQEKAIETKNSQYMESVVRHDKRVG